MFAQTSETGMESNLISVKSALNQTHYLWYNDKINSNVLFVSHAWLVFQIGNLIFVFFPIS